MIWHLCRGGALAPLFSLASAPLFLLTLAQFFLRVVAPFDLVSPTQEDTHVN